MDDFKASESHLAAPLAEVRAAKVEGLAEFNEHVQRHEQTKNILAPRIVDDVLDGHECATRRKRVVRGANQVQLLLQIPVVQDHAHRDEVGLGQRVGEKIACTGADTATESSGGDALARDGFNGGQI